jgi:NADH pyrophosphatase NudC (nudix superfamily)
MDIGSLFLILGILIPVVLFISRPFLIHKSNIVSSIDLKLSVLLAEQERLINTIQELDFDHSMGKIPEVDYSTQRAGLLSHAADVMRQVDALRIETPAVYLTSQTESIAAASPSSGQVALKRPGKRSIPAGTVQDDEMEALIAARRRERSEKAAGFCPQCGKPIQLSDRFCPRCGAPLILEENRET